MNRLTDLTLQHIQASILDAVTFAKHSPRVKKRSSKPYTTTQYTDLRPWMALNYTVAGCLLLLISLAAWSLSNAF